MTHLCYMSDSKLNRKKIKAVVELIKNRDSKNASFLGEKLKMKSRRVARLLGRIECIEREKKYNRYQYKVDINPPQKLKVGEDSVIEIKEIEEDGEKYILIKTEDEEKKVRRNVR